VRGYADTKPRVVEDPMAAENRRISVLLPFSQLRTASDSSSHGD
jgi:chemotaxis protein MotB